MLRPRFVWGQGDTSVLPEIVAAVDDGRFAWPSGGRYLTSTTHVDNVVAPEPGSTSARIIGSATTGP